MRVYALWVDVTGGMDGRVCGIFDGPSGKKIAADLTCAWKFGCHSDSLRKGWTIPESFVEAVAHSEAQDFRKVPFEKFKDKIRKTGGLYATFLRGEKRDDPQKLKPLGEAYKIWPTSHSMGEWNLNSDPLNWLYPEICPQAIRDAFPEVDFTYIPYSTYAEFKSKKNSKSEIKKSVKAKEDLAKRKEAAILMKNLEQLKFATTETEKALETLKCEMSKMGINTDSLKAVPASKPGDSYSYFGMACEQAVNLSKAGKFF